MQQFEIKIFKLVVEINGREYAWGKVGIGNDLPYQPFMTAEDAFDEGSRLKGKEEINNFRVVPETIEIRRFSAVYN